MFYEYIKTASLTDFLHNHLLWFTFHCMIIKHFFAYNEDFVTTQMLNIHINFNRSLLKYIFIDIKPVGTFSWAHKGNICMLNHLTISSQWAKNHCGGVYF